MAIAVLTLSLVALIYGLVQPSGVLPGVLGTPNRWKVAGLYGSAFIVSLGAVDPEPPTDSVAAVQTAGEFAEADEDPWPGGPDARAHAFAELASFASAGRWVEVQDHARSLAAEPYAAEWADSLRHVANVAEEEVTFERARRLPGSDLEGNRDAYAELAERWPSSERAALYAQKRDTYAQRIVDRDNARFRAAQARSRPRSAARSSGCCKRCSAGKPCGNSCISRSYTCHQPPGCAC